MNIQATRYIVIEKKNKFRSLPLSSKRYSIWILVLFMACSCAESESERFVANAGILDGLHISASTCIYLDGEWDFYPNVLLTPLEVNQLSSTQTMESPGLWKSIPQGNSIRFATYRLRLINHQLPAVFSIRNHQIYSAFTLYLNGEKVLANGAVSSTKEMEVPGYHPRTVSVHSNADTLDFVLQISNHHFRDGGIAESLVIGEAESLMRKNLGSAGFYFFLLGSLLIMAIYYLSLFVVLKKEQSSLYFSIFIFISILRILVTGQKILFFIFPSLSWEVMLRLEYSSFYIAPIFFILFFNAIYREEVKIYVVNMVMAISGVFTLLAIFTPVNFFTNTLLFYQIYLTLLGIALISWLIKALQHKKEGAEVLLLGIVILFITLLHDMAFVYGHIRGVELFPAGIFILILCQSYVLTIKFADINKENQALWEELDFKNQNLEQLVKKRTMELEKQKDLLQITNTELEQQKHTMQNQSRIMEDINELLEKEKEKTDQLLLNVLPKHIANELKLFGKSLAHNYPQVSVLFVDFVGFSDVSENLPADALLKELHFYFTGFDDITRKYNLEKIKTIGDSYMCAGGLHEDANERDVKNTVMAALEINMFVQAHHAEQQAMGQEGFDCRIGIHTGPVIAGVVGKTKFSFDIWGPTVNIAKRMESACEPGKVNVSEFTYQYIKNDFICRSRGIITMKHKKNMQMFFVESIR